MLCGVSKVSKSELITQNRLKEILHYNSDTGIWIRLVDTRNKIKSGSRAGTCTVKGYRRIKIEKKHYFEHRLAWLYMTGEWPENDIDHIDGNRSNNKWSNLRSATRQQNRMNTKKLGIKKKNFDLPVGVIRRSGRFGAVCKSNKKRKSLGMFDTAEQAHQRYLTFIKDKYGEFVK